MYQPSSNRRKTDIDFILNDSETILPNRRPTFTTPSFYFKDFATDLAGFSSGQSSVLPPPDLASTSTNRNKACDKDIFLWELGEKPAAASKIRHPCEEDSLFIGEWDDWERSIAKSLHSRAPSHDRSSSSTKFAASRFRLPRYADSSSPVTDCAEVLPSAEFTILGLDREISSDVDFGGTNTAPSSIFSDTSEPSAELCNHTFACTRCGDVQPNSTLKEHKTTKSTSGQISGNQSTDQTASHFAGQLASNGHPKNGTEEIRKGQGKRHMPDSDSDEDKRPRKVRESGVRRVPKSRRYSYERTAIFRAPRVAPTGKISDIWKVSEACLNIFPSFSLPRKTTNEVNG